MRIIKELGQADVGEGALRTNLFGGRGGKHKKYVKESNKDDNLKKKYYFCEKYFTIKGCCGIHYEAVATIKIKV